ncbi:Crp/Fnr family transcriptional regulator [Virgibacillus kimchii]
MEPLLTRLNETDYRNLLDNSRPMEVNKGDIIYKEKSPSDYLYFIHTGEIRIFKKMGRDKELTIFIRKENDAFGEIGVFGGGNYSNTAQALKKSMVSVIKKGEVENLIEANGKLGLHFTKWVAESLEISKAKIRDYISFGSEGAVASVFVRYSNMNGIVTTEGVRLTEPIMIRDISMHIGISRETVSRVVSKWKEQGVISNNNKFYIIKDMDYFKKLLACEYCGVENCVI